MLPIRLPQIQSGPLSQSRSPIRSGRRGLSPGLRAEDNRRCAFRMVAFLVFYLNIIYSSRGIIHKYRFNHPQPTRMIGSRGNGGKYQHLPSNRAICLLERIGFPLSLPWRLAIAMISPMSRQETNLLMFLLTVDG